MRLKQEPVYRKLWLVGTFESQQKSSVQRRTVRGMACLSQETSYPGQEFLCCNDNEMKINKWRTEMPNTYYV